MILKLTDSSEVRCRSVLFNADKVWIDGRPMPASDFFEKIIVFADDKEKGVCNMDFLTKEVCIKERNGLSIMLLHEGDVWEVYMRLPHYAYNFAFGIPDSYTSADVFKIAFKSSNDWKRILFPEEDELNG